MEKWLITQLFPLFFGAFFITQKLPQVNDCQKTIQYTVETTTTKRDFTQSEKLYTPPMLSDPLSTETDTALLNICVAHGGNCTWEVDGKNKSKLSPVGLYTVSMLRQMAGDWMPHSGDQIVRIGDRKSVV